MHSLSRRSFLAGSAAAVAASVLPARVLAADAPKFKLGMISYNVAKDWDLDTILKVCKEVGIAALEARSTHKHGIEITLPASERPTVKKKFADSGVAFWGCGSACEFHSPDPEVVKKNIEECKQFIKLTVDLGGRGVKVRPNGIPVAKDAPKGTLPTDAQVAKTCEQIGKALRECGKAASDAGIEICMEVHGRITQLPKNAHAIMQACGHPSVGVTWNSNETDVVNGSIAESFALLKPFLKSCHINDLTKDASGVYPYRELFKKFREMGYDRYTMCEYNKSFDPVAGLEFMKGYKKLWTELANG